MAYDPENGNFNLSIRSAMIIEHASCNAIAQRIHDEVQAYLVNDPDFRILVSEGVREAMSKLNVTEVVQAAVQEVLKAQKPPLPGEAERRTG